MRQDLRLIVDSQYASPYAMSVFVALHEAGLPFEIQPIDLSAKENHTADFSVLSLTRRVPTLVHGGFSLSESSAITEYLCDAFPGVRLYPDDPKSRARARQIQAWLRSDLMPIRQERTTEVVFYGAKAKPLSASALQCAETLYSVAGAMLAAGAENLFGRLPILTWRSCSIAWRCMAIQFQSALSRMRSSSGGGRQSSFGSIKRGYRCEAGLTGCSSGQFESPRFSCGPVGLSHAAAVAV